MSEGERFPNAQLLFIKALGLIYFAAFASFGVQARALIGSHGIEPATGYLGRAWQALGGGAFWAAPSVFWLNSGDRFLLASCWAGMAAAVLILWGTFWRGALVAAWILYLSLVNVSQDFLSYQWDYLLLEAGFLAIFIGYSNGVVWLFRWLLFRLMFGSGLVKLTSGDPAWRNLTALTVHYQTQPLPTPLAWYAQTLPAWLQKASCGMMFFIELAIPFLVFAPRRFRHFAAYWIIALQALILLTGNYAFFNWLTIALCLWLFAGESSPPKGRWRGRLGFAVVVAVAALSSLQMLRTVIGHLPPGGAQALAFTGPFGITSSYGLFAVMTVTRPEIVVEGSNDGREWLAYEFRYKPGRLDRRPPWVAPHQPRLDWQMWFAALGSYRENAWFLRFLTRLLQGEPSVLALLEYNPFPAKPPLFVRATVYDYRFTTFDERRRTGQWWMRKPLGAYVPAVSLRNLEP